MGIDSLWALPGGGSWNVDANWVGGVPSAPGDTARFGELNPRQSTQITLDGPVSLDQLIVANPNNITLSGAEPLRLDAGAGRFALIESLPQSGTLRFLTPIVLDPDGVNVNVEDGSRVRVSAPLAPSSGAIFKLGAGTLVLETDNAAWNGPLRIQEGAVQMSITGALGSESAMMADGTFVGDGGTLQINAPNVSTSEHITLRGGTLESTFASRTGSSTITGPVTLETDSFLGAARNTTGLIITGNIQGPGGFTFDGGTARIAGDNSYLGPTHVRSGTLIITSSSSLGSTRNPQESTTTVGPGAAVVFDMGWSGLIAPSDDFVLDGATLEFRGKRASGQRTATAVIRGNVEILPDRTSTFRIATIPDEWTHQQDITFRGVSGQGSLDIVFPIAENAYRDNQREFTMVKFVDAPVEIAGGLSFRQEIARPQIDLRLTHDVQYSVPVVADRLSLDDGGLTFPTSGNNPIPYLTVRFNDHAQFGAIVLDGPRLLGANILESDEETLDLRKGVIELSRDGRLLGVSNIAKTTSARAELRNVPDASEIRDVDISNGVLEFRNVSEANGTTVRINRSDYAAMLLTGTFDGTIELNNAKGVPFEAAALHGDRDSTGMVNGPVQLGDVGSVIGGHRLAINGQVSGGDLHVTGDVTLGGNNTYTGDTMIRGTHAGFGNLEVTGSIAASPRIVIADNARLAAGPQSLHPVVHIDLGGGLFDVRGSGVTGPLSITPGDSNIRFEDNSRITFQSIDQEDGGLVSILNYDGILGATSNSDPRLMFQQPPETTRGIVGPWLTVTQPTRTDFAQYDAVNGISILPSASRPSQVDGATASDNVLATEPLRPLTRDTTINSLNISLTEPGFDRFDLQGNTLTIDSGGLLLSDSRSREVTIANGQLTSNQSTLYVTTPRNLAIEASIVDGMVPLSVTFRGETSASGSNIYSGLTRVLGNHTVPRRHSIPAGSDVIVQGIDAALNLRYPGDAPLELGTLLLRENARVDGVAIQADLLQLQSGRVKSNLIGNGTLHKTGPDAVTLELATSMRDFSGPIVVDDGTLTAQAGNGLLGSGPITINGGRVVLFSEFHRRNEDALVTSVANAITLNGGDLSAGWHGDAFTEGIAKPDPFRFEGPLDVMGDSAILTFAPGFYPFFTGAISRLSDQLPTTVTLANVVSLAEGATLRKLGPGDLTVTGPLMVSAGTSIVVEEDNMRVEGDIHSNHATSVLEFANTNPGTSWTLDSSIRVNASNSLQLLDNGAPIEINLSRGKSVGGEGSLGNGVILQRGARISPGEGVGQLNINGDLTFLGGSIYEWEVNDASGTAGEQPGWDLIDVSETLRFAATPESPFVLRLLNRSGPNGDDPLAGFDPLRGFSWPVAGAHSIDGFDSSLVRIDSASLITANPIPDDGRFLLTTLDGSQLVLRYDVFADMLCDVTVDGTCDFQDINTLSAAIRAGDSDSAFDLNRDGSVNTEDRRFWVEDLLNTWFGDANLDGRFDQLDLVQVLRLGQYADAIPLNGLWQAGDWNGDQEVDRLDLVLALQSNGYLQGPRQALQPIPEPTTVALLLCGALATWVSRWRCSRPR